jgi:hypothetical protein
VFLTGLGVPKLWRGDPEALWPYFLRPYVATFVSYLSPAYGYGMDRVPAEGGGVIAAKPAASSPKATWSVSSSRGRARNSAIPERFFPAA